MEENLLFFLPFLLVVAPRRRPAYLPEATSTPVRASCAVPLSPAPTGARCGNTQCGSSRCVRVALAAECQQRHQRGMKL